MGRLPEQRSSSEVVETMRRKLLGYLEAVEEAVEPSRHAYRFFSYLVHVRKNLTVSYRLLSERPERVSDMFREAERVSREHPETMADVDGRSDMLRGWTELLLEAATRVEREERWGNVYAEQADDEDDLFADASAAEAGSRWQTTN